MRYLAILETMWNWDNLTHSAGYVEEAPRFFRINPGNFSGGRLYRLIGNNQLLVTNACKEVVHHAAQHGNPNITWLSENLKQVGDRADTILVCGTIAQKAFAYVKDKPQCRIVYMPHPAARNWTTESLEKAGKYIQEWEANLFLRIVNMKLQVRRLR